MLVLSTSSVCDVCLDSFTDGKVPYAITCGHTFCLRCLQQLTRHTCPLCRTPFDPAELRKLHVEYSRSSTPPPPGSSESREAQVYMKHITRIVREGAMASEVNELIQEIHAWLQTQPEKEHADLRSAHVLLYKYTEMQRKGKEEKYLLAEAQQVRQDLVKQLSELEEAAEVRLHEQLRLQREAAEEQLREQQESAEREIEELQRKREHDREVAHAVESSLREELERLDKDWAGKYDTCLAECREVLEWAKELERRSRNPLPIPPRPIESRFLFKERSIDLMDLSQSRDDPFDSPPIKNSKGDVFRISPVPPTLAISPLLPNAFRSLSGYASDEDDERRSQSSSGSSYLRQPIPIEPKMTRRPSNASLLSRYDDPMSQSLPRGTPDVHMESCSSSPSVSGIRFSNRERHGDVIPYPTRLAQQESRTSAASVLDRISAPFRPLTQEDEHARSRAQLRELLDDPPIAHRVRAISPSESGLEPSSTHHCQSTAPSMTQTSNPSPSPPPPVVPPPVMPPPQSSMQRMGTISRASEAAKAAERARAKKSSMTQTPPSPSAASKERDIMSSSSPAYYQPPAVRATTSASHDQAKPMYPRQPSTGSPTAKASGLTQTFRAMREVQGVS
ncbi:hypothetical protein WOLCODRAFT_141007 [Wolfiporia cocos MD-104 SS10]|uniref:RING-type domain-containing protein n=1 Tax=Wolfiporia cocos (strain MD-104) TaxID=742152 RepID=A0A2H3JQJ8_WOLCO|nr:hypothetical protein WOLCODRAFT_141007 [Wolfiporia cocos MD-104 SS10]